MSFFPGVCPAEQDGHFSSSALYVNLLATALLPDSFIITSLISAKIPAVRLVIDRT